ncbi:unnamed protein product [Brachionus calyciflorus]|uniref:DOMON domain-containing protein n=1 Tax=Brachionus calyciflorus TaxID=104777 RepID=A0A814NCN2_9BILA|nr:unnamed protein product [Brachionus calyciflorus]
MKFFLILILAGFISCQNSINLLNSHIQWENTGKETNFVITSNLAGKIDPKNAWIAVGLNTNPVMPGTNAVICQQALVTHAFLGSYSQPLLLDPSTPTVGLSNSKLMTIGSNLTCVFTRQNFINIPKYHDLNSNYNFHLLVAYGFGSFGYHSSNREVSNEKLNFSPSQTTLEQIYSTKSNTFLVNTTTIQNSTQIPLETSTLITRTTTELIQESTTKQNSIVQTTTTTTATPSIDKITVKFLWTQLFDFLKKFIKNLLGL